MFRKTYTLTLLAGCLLLSACASQPAEQAKEQAPRTYSFWPSSPDEPRIQFLTTFNNSRDVGRQRSSFDRMVYGAAVDQTHAISKPYGAAMWNGRIYVCDVRGAGVTVMDIRQQQTRIMGASGTGRIGKGVGIAITPDGIKYVIDAAQSAVIVFSPDERFVQAFPIKDGSPVGIAVHGDRVYVADFKNARIRVLDRNTGTEVQSIGERGDKDGQFVGILGVAIDPQGNIYASDTIRARIQKFAPDGTFLLGFGQPGNRPGDFVRPKHMAVDSEGSLHVVDAAFNNVQVFDSNGNVIGNYGGIGRFPGAMDLPAGIDVHEGDLDLFASYVHPAFDAQRLILLTNQFGEQKVSIYAMGRLKPGKTPADVARNRTQFGLTPATAPATRPAAGAQK